MDDTRHVSVLERELVEHVLVESSGHYLDCTLGGAGHARAILRANPTNRVTAIDRDSRALKRAEKLRAEVGERLQLHQSKFGEVAQLLSGQKFDGMYADLGTSMDQLHEQRGFSFHDASPLDMRMDENQELSAAEIVNTWSEKQLFRMFKEGGVGQEASALVRAIVAARPIDDTRSLARIIENASSPKSKEKKRHPATLAFQALRIAVNDELAEIRSLLAAAPQLVEDGGRLAVISFHSIEDKLVTKTMRKWQGENAPANTPGAMGTPSIGKLLTKKAIVPTQEETQTNPSSRSARMRVFKFQRENQGG